MDIFIDEGGQFTPSDRIGVHAALAIPTQWTSRLRREITRLTCDWPRVEGELKGGQLSSHHLVHLVDALYRREALLFYTIIDMKQEGDEEVTTHKLGQR